MLMIAFIGVRISWLIIARNDPFARFASTACSRAATRSRCDACCAATASSIARPSSRSSPRPSTETGAGLEVAGRHLACRGEDRADLAQEQRLADEPGNQETEERADREKGEVAEERGVHGGAIGGQSDPERDAGARMLLRETPAARPRTDARRRRGRQSPERCRAAVERRRPRSRVLADVLLQIHRPVLDDALAVENGQHGARREGRSVR